jgi:hypothetical protein
MILQRQEKYEKLPHEVFALLETTKKISERISILQDNASYSIKTILQASFQENIIFDLPEGAPPYTASTIPAGMQRSSLKKQVEMLPRLLVGYDRIDKMKKEMLFIRLLEDVDAKDAEILIAMKDKKLTKLYPLVTVGLVRKSFPTLLPLPPAE